MECRATDPRKPRDSPNHGTGFVFWLRAQSSLREENPAPGLDWGAGFVGRAQLSDMMPVLCIIYRYASNVPCFE